MEIITIPSVGAFGVNAYIAVSDKGNGALIDAPDLAPVMNRLYSNDIDLKLILLTHGHCDHINAAAEIARKTGARIFINPADKAKLTNDNTNLTRYFSLPPIDPVTVSEDAQDGQIISLDEMDFEVLSTPGHTSGSVCYILEENMFCGDTLFKGSIGRTDMPDGDDDVMAQTLAMLYEFDTGTNYKLYPGHGEPSDMESERSNNPYMRYAAKKLGGKGSA